ncbi:MAG TPA: hypothetical protein PLB10_06140 [Thiolinea sp.]|nr:hypothetical protein [Thiolinea sp.]
MKEILKGILIKSHLLDPAKSARNATITFFSRKKWHSLLNSELILLELGSGPKKGTNGWTTVDLIGADISHS